MVGLKITKRQGVGGFLILCAHALVALQLRLAVLFNEEPLKAQYAILVPTKSETEKETRNSTGIFFDKQDDGAAVFYNLYLPRGDQKAITHILENIVDDQFRQVGASAAAGFPVYINTIEEPIKAEQFLPICKKYHLKCRHLHHYDQGFEMVTLGDLLQYCRQYPQNRVVYLHPKGSFHPSPSNNRWRRGLTAGSTSKSCISPPDDTCNVCGRTFVSSWGPVFAGSMFAAKCNYVQKLVPPSELEYQMKKAYDTRPENMTFTLFDMSYEYSLAQGRFAAEYFIGSHPDLVPCEGYTDGSFSMVPSKPFLRTAMSYINRTAYNELMMEKGGSYNEFFLLPGLLWRWHVMYNSTPSNSSWVWTHFPDGIKWRDALHEFGGVPSALKALMKQR